MGEFFVVVNVVVERTQPLADPVWRKRLICLVLHVGQTFAVN
jgi:hypothetical protein